MCLPYYKDYAEALEGRTECLPTEVLEGRTECPPCNKDYYKDYTEVLEGRRE